MVIKIQRRSNVFPFLMTMHKYVGNVKKICQGTWTKTINYLQGFHIKAVLENTSYHDLSNSKENTHCGIPFQ